METAAVRTPDRILTHALQLFSTKGYDATSVREICEAAGITKPTLYHFYGSKEGVYQALVDGAFSDFRRDLQEAVESSGPVAVRLKRVAASYFRCVHENRELMRFIFALIHNPPSSAPRTDFPTFYADVVKRIAGVVEEGEASGELVPGSLEIRMLVFMGALGESVCGNLIVGKPALTPELADALVESVLTGWRPAPPPRRKVAVAGLLLALGLLAPVAGAEPLSRAEAVKAALGVNPDVQRSRQELRRVQGYATEAKADALPEVTVNASAVRYRDPSFLNSSSFDAFPPELRGSLVPVAANLYDASLSLRQTLFSFKLGHAVRAARYGTQWGEAEVRRSEQRTALLAVRAYDEHVLALEKVKVGEKAVRQKQEHLAAAKNRRDAGVATDLEVLRAQVDLANQESILLRFRGEAEQSRATLNAVMVRPLDTAVEPTDSLAFEDQDPAFEDVVQAAWANRPEAQAAALNEKIREELAGLAAAEGKPSLDLDATWGYSVRKPGNFLEQDFQKWNAGVSLTIPVFDGRRTAGRVVQARAEREKARQDTIALENNIRLEAKQAVDRLRVAKSVLGATALNVSQAQQALEMTQANYRLGAATTLDVLDAGAAVVLAESTRLQALFDHAQARATLRYVMAQDPLAAPAPPVDARQ